MKHVAICMRGAVSKYSLSRFDGGYKRTKDAIYEDAPYININIIHHYIQQHIITVNPSYNFDFFLHCWNPDLEEKLTLLYHPKQSLFEKNTAYHNEINKKIKRQDDYGTVSHCLSYKKSIQLKEEYEKNNHVRYDIVILLRYDVVLLKNMILSTYDTKHYLYYGNLSYFHSIFPLSFGMGIGDFHFVMNSNHSRIFKNMYHWIGKHNTSYNPHEFIVTYLLSKHCKLHQDHIYSVTDEDVLRKFHPSKLITLHGITKKDMYHGSFSTHMNMLFVCKCTVLLLIIRSLFLKITYMSMVYLIVLSSVCFVSIIYLLLFYIDAPYLLYVIILIWCFSFYL